MVIVGLLIGSTASSRRAAEMVVVRHGGRRWISAPRRWRRGGGEDEGRISPKRQLASTSGISPWLVDTAPALCSSSCSFSDQSSSSSCGSVQGSGGAGAAVHHQRRRTSRRCARESMASLAKLLAFSAVGEESCGSFVSLA
jgi:hypothetical protein